MSVQKEAIGRIPFGDKVEGFLAGLIMPDLKKKARGIIKTNVVRTKQSILLGEFMEEDLVNLREDEEKQEWYGQILRLTRGDEGEQEEAAEILLELDPLSVEMAGFTDFWNRYWAQRYGLHEEVYPQVSSRD